MTRDLLALQKEFVNLRNGVFIHFNSATEQFNDSDVKDWDYGITDVNDPKRHVFEPISWNPNQLDCKEWAAVAKSGKANFAALTAKHHEGFCLWPTETTNHCVSNASFKEDVVKEYLEQFRKADILPGLYFSMLDLHHGITEKKCTLEDKEFIKTQLKELLTNYGDIPFIIFDGWQAPWGGPSYENLGFEEIDTFIKSLQPECLVMNIGNGEDINTTDIIFYENAAGQDADESFVGPGASCNIYTDTWFWRKNHPESELKPVSWAVEKVKSNNAQNISFLMNISPNKFGKVDINLISRFKEFGEKYEELSQLEELPKNWLIRQS